MEERTIPMLREYIDSLDNEIIRLLHERAGKALEIGRLKRMNGLPAFDAARERTLLDAVVQRGDAALSGAALRRVFTEIISACREVQAPVKVSYLGPECTFTHQAAIEYFGRSCDFVPRDSIVDVFRDVQSRQTAFGVAPVENSSEGPVGLTLDQLAASDVRISGEIFLPISHALMSRESDISDVTEALSHPQALGQCVQWLSRNLPGRPLAQMSSTAAAARKAAETPGAAAIGNEALAQLYGLEVLARDIQDHSPNVTRFIVLGGEMCSATGRDRTSILFSTPHHPGALIRALTPFSASGINITRIESRPSKDTPWEYIFFADFEGHLSDEAVKEALHEMAPFVNRFKALGSYPIGERRGECTTENAFAQEARSSRGVCRV
jgi:chorismate mutase/prephenate dehydratase